VELTYEGRRGTGDARVAGNCLGHGLDRGGDQELEKNLKQGLDRKLESYDIKFEAKESVIKSTSQ